VAVALGWQPAAKSATKMKVNKREFDIFVFIIDLQFLIVMV
jgi:hypothetical protein